MKLSSSDTKEESKNWKLQYKIPNKYITCWLGYEKNQYKDKFQKTNHFRNVFVSQRWVYSLLVRYYITGDERGMKKWPKYEWSAEKQI